MLVAQKLAEQHYEVFHSQRKNADKLAADAEDIDELEQMVKAVDEA